MFQRPALLVAALSALVLSVAPSFAKSYRITRVEIAGEVEADGTLLVSETREYEFDGRFSYAYWTQDRKGDIRLSEVSVSSDGQVYERNASEQPGTWHLEEDDGGWRVTWHFAARDERRVFTLRYRVAGAVSKFSDVGDCYFNFIGDGWSVSQRNIVIDVRLPKPVAPQDMRVWAHGPLWGGVAKAAAGRARATIDLLPPKTFFDVRVVFPADVLANMPLTQDKPMLPRILDVERRHAEQANARRAAAQAAQERREWWFGALLWIGGVFMGVALLIYIPWWLPAVRPHRVPEPPRDQMEPPTDHAPAAVAYLFHGSEPGGTTLVATMFHLAERGLFEVREVPREVPGFFGPKTEIDYHFVPTELDHRRGELDPYEQALLDFLFEHAAKEGAISMRALRKGAQKDRTAFRRWFREWGKSLAKQYKECGWWEPWKVGLLTYGALVSVALMALGIAFFILFESPLGMIGIGVGAVMLVSLAATQRHTPAGRELYLRWKAYRDYLKGLPSMPDSVLTRVGGWGRHLCYAIVLGQYRRLAKGLDRLDTHRTHGVAVVPWYYGSSANAADGGMSGLGTAMSSMVTSVSSSMSSASGAGGGAAGGGGGGAGGSGGGAG